MSHCITNLSNMEPIQRSNNVCRFSTKVKKQSGQTPYDKQMCQVLIFMMVYYMITRAILIGDDMAATNHIQLYLSNHNSCIRFTIT